MSNLLIILKKELKELFRDKKSLAMMLIIPFMIPLIIIGLSALFDMQENKDIKTYNNIGFNYELSKDELKIANDLMIKVTIKDEKELKKDYDNGKINLYITKTDNKYTLNGNQDENTSRAAALAEVYFSKYKEYLQKNYLEENGFNSDELINIITIDQNITEKENFYANYITTYGFLFIIMAITVSATYPATDATAGEKERGTLETLKTFPIKNKDIIIGKLFSVVVSNVITGILSLALLYVSLILAGNMFEIYKGIDITLSIETLIFIFIVVILFSLLIAAICISVASKCKTFKEAQSALTPFIFIAFFPSMIAFMIDLKSSLILSIVPFMNFTLLFNDVVEGSVNYLYILVMILSSIVFIYIMLKIVIKQYNSENIIL